MRFNHNLLPVLPLALALTLASGCGHQSTSSVQEAVDFQDQPDLFTQPMRGAVAESLAPVAVVDGAPISRAELQREAQLIALNLRQRLSPEQFKELSPRIQQEALQGIIIRRLLGGAVTAEHIEVAPELIDEKLAELRATVEQNSEWSEFLAGSHLTDDEVREHLATRMRIDTLVQSRVQDVSSPSDQEIQAYYDEHLDQFLQSESVQLRHLFLKVDPGADQQTWDQAREKADALLRAIVEDGANFEALVAEHSDDATSRDRGGVLGTFGRGKILPELEAAAFSATVGEVVPPVQTSLGLHLLRVDAREPARQLSFDETREWIRSQLGQQRKQEAFQAYLRNLVDAADVVLPSQPAANPGGG